MENMTPLYRQYKSIKDQFSDAILLFRLGDFYEAFEEDAKIISQELDIVLTSKEIGKGRRIPMAGVPYHALDSYLSKLVQKKYKVAICEQVEDPALAKGLVKREVVRVITPGTLVEDTLLEDKNNNFLSSIYALNKEYISLATIDVSTGEFFATEWRGKEAEEIIYSELVRLKPKEIILPFSLKDLFSELLTDLKREVDPKITLLDDNYFQFSDYAIKYSDDKEKYPLAERSVNGALNYIKEVMFTIPTHIERVEIYQPQQYLILDSTAIKHLELLETVREGQRRGSLIWVLDKTLTSMGARLLKKWILQPLLNVNAIKKRQGAIKEFLEKEPWRREIEDILKEMPDLERINSRINYNTATPKELIYLRQALSFLPLLRKSLEKAESDRLKELKENLPDLEPLYEELDRALVESPPSHIKDGGYIKDGYDPNLDELRRLLRESKDWLINLENRERERTGIKSLKIGYNQVFGYYIEVTKANLNLVPPDYIRKQTLVNAERFITPELKEWENKILHAEDNIKKIEEELFQNLRKKVIEHSRDITTFAQIIGEIDCLYFSCKSGKRVQLRMSSGYQ